MRTFRCFLGLIFLCFHPFTNYSQEKLQEFCGFNKNMPYLESDVLKQISGQSASNQVYSSTIYTIPVVFHVFHQGGSENIQDSQMFDAIDILNRDYRKKNADTVNIIPSFKSLATDVGFEFRLATMDPNGNCTNGIVRHYDPATNWVANPYVANQYIYTWDPTKYLNIYVVKSISGMSASAYAYPPGLVNTPNEDIVVIKYNLVGSIGTSNIIASRTLTHEIGHWFNLLHTWGFSTIGTVCGDDGVADTPITKGFLTCPINGTAICNPPIIENHQNYMDYSSCSVMFTIGQANRMLAAINSSVAGRNNLFTVQNLNTTGVSSPTGQCLPIPAFYTTYNNNNQQEVYSVCEGEALTFVDVSFNGTISARSWSGPADVLIASPTATRTIITFTSAGLKTIVLSVTNSLGTTTLSKIVNVLSVTAEIQGSNSESFESPGLPPHYSIINPDNDVTWTQTDTSSATGLNSYYIFGNGDAPGRIDILETPSYDFQNSLLPLFTFKYAYAKNSASSSDLFKVQATDNCGGSWSDIYLPSITIFANASGGVNSAPFYPSPDQFVTYTLSTHPNFTSFLTKNNVRFRFYFQEDKTSGYGNNIFLDDINFTVEPNGLSDNSKSTQFLDIYPVPASSQFSIAYNSTNEEEVVVRMLDALGNTSFIKRINNTGQGRKDVIIDSKLNPGIYFVILTNGDKVFSKPMIIEQ